MVSTYTFQIVVGLKYANLDVLCQNYNIDIPQILSEIKLNEVDAYLDELPKDITIPLDSITKFIQTYDPFNSLELLEIIPSYISGKLGCFKVIKGFSEIIPDEDNVNYEFIVGDIIDTDECACMIDSIKRISETFTLTFGSQPKVYTFSVCQ